MTKKTINIGQTANDRKGDSLRAAFGKVNDNFTELYNNLGADGTPFNPLNVDSNIVPKTDNVYDLGSPAKQWRHVYTAGGSIYLDNIKLTNNAGKLEVTKVINPGQENEEPDPEDSNAGDSVTSKLTNGEHTFELMDDGSLELDGDPFTGGGGSTGQWAFNGDTAYNNTGNGLYIQPGQGNADGSIYIPTTEEGGDLTISNNSGGTGAITVSTNNKTWVFDAQGDLSLPAGGDIKDSNGSSVLGGGGFTLPPDTTFDDFYEDGGATIYNSGGKIQLYSLVSEGNDGVNIRVKGDGGDSTWEFKSNGSITFPDNELKTSVDNDLSIVTEYSPPVPPTTIEIIGADFVAVNLTYTKDGANSIWYPADYNPANDPYIEFTGGHYGIRHPAFGQPIYVNTGTLNVPLAQWNTNPPLGSVAPTGVYTYPNTYTRTWSFDTKGAINLPDPGTIRNTSGAANLVATDYAQLQWTTQAGANDPDPNGTQEPKNWIFVDVSGAYIETNINGTGQSHAWDFTNDGNLILPTGGDIKDRDGNSVLGGSGGSPTVWVEQLYYDTTVNAAWSALTPMAVVSTEYDSNGNIIALVINYDNAGPAFTTVMKINSQGVILAQTEFADSVELDGWGLAVDSSDNVYLCGQINNVANNDMFVSKLDSDLQEVWSKKLDGTNNEYGYVIDCGGDGHPVVVGTASFDSNAIYTVKLDKDTGNILWQRYLNNSESSTNESAWGMAVGPSGEVVAVGLGGNNYRQLVVKYNVYGVLEWQKEIILDDGLNCYAGDAEIDLDGNIYVLGVYEWGGGNQGISLTKLNSSGVAQWTRKVQGPCAATASSIVMGDDGFLYISSTMGETVNDGGPGIKLNQVLAKYNADTGSVIWQRYFKHAGEWVVGANFLSGYGAGSNLAVKNGRFALGTTRTLAYFNGNQSDNKAVLFQGATDGTEQNFGGFSFIASSLPGILGSPFAVNNTNYSDNEGELDVSNWETGTEPGNISATFYGSGSATNELTNGQYSITLNSDGRLSLPNLDNTGWNYNYNLNGPTLKLGVATDQVIITGPTATQGNPSARRLIIQGQRGYGHWGQNTAGEGGDVYIWGGTGGESDGGGGSGGDIKVRGGQGQNSDGGYVKIEGGQAAGWNNSPTGGYVEIRGGDAVEGGNGNGGNVRIYGGKKHGTGNNGEVHISTGANEEFEWSFDNGGVLQLSSQGKILGTNTLTLKGTSGVTVQTVNPMNPLATRDWTFGANGHLTFPNGTVQTTAYTGAGAPTIPSTVKGWYQIQGLRPNNNNEVLWQTVAVTPGGESFTAGKNYYSNPRGDATIVIQKHSTSGEVLLSKRIGAGYGATFTVVVAGGVLSITGVTNLGGQGYQVNEKLVMWGAQWSDYSYSSIWTLNVDSVDEEGNGAILTASVVDQPITPPADGIYNFVSPVKSDLTLYANSMVYNNECEQVFLSAEYQSGYKTQTDGDVTWAMIYVLDSSTLAVMATYLLKDEADLYPISITANDNGDIAVVGQKYNEYRAIPITGYTGGTNYLAISKTVMGEHFPESGIPGDEYYNFFVQGTGINGQTQVSSVNYYPSVATTVREGSGAAFSIWNNGDGTYGWNGITYGTNYRVGHKIKLLGTDLGGTSPANDAIVTVTSINNDVQGGISSITISGSAAGVGPQVNYPNVTGTNYQVGSGARVNIGVDPVTDLITTVGTDNFGDYHYVVGDVLTVSGTVFPGGTSPANDVVLTVTAVYLGGGPNGYTVVSGTPPTGILRLNIDGYDFSTGTYTMRQSLNSEAFVWTPSWNQAIGGGGDDYFQSVIFGSDGTHIYAVGKGRYEVTYDQALVVKMTKGNGTIVWSKYVNSYLSPGSEVNASASSVIQLNNNNIVVSFSQYNNSFLSDEIGLVALDTNGVLQWTKTYLLDNGSPDSEHRLLRDGSNNIYVVFRGYNARNGDNAWNILKLDSTGDKIWARAITNNGMSMYFNYSWGNEFAALSNTHIYIAGYTYIPNDNNSTSLLIRFPVDGYKEFAEEGWARGESFGDLSIFKPATITTTPVATPQTFTPDVHQNGITTVANYNMGYVYTDEYEVPALLVKFTRDDLGYLEFGDGSKQSFATDRIPQILASNNQYIKLSPQDSGKHYFIGPDQSGVEFIIPEYDIEDPYPLGYTVTIVNCSGGDVYVTMYNPDNGNYYYGSIWGAGRDIQTRYWGIPDSGSGSLVTLMKVKNAQYSGGENESGPIWMIAGPSDIYNND